MPNAFSSIFLTQNKFLGFIPYIGKNKWIKEDEYKMDKSVLKGANKQAFLMPQFSCLSSKPPEHLNSLLKNINPCSINTYYWYIIFLRLEATGELGGEASNEPPGAAKWGCCSSSNSRSEPSRWTPPPTHTSHSWWIHLPHPTPLRTPATWISFSPFSRFSSSPQYLIINTISRK